jgi:hypothetical protein
MSFYQVILKIFESFRLFCAKRYFSELVTLQKDEPYEIVIRYNYFEDAIIKYMDQKRMPNTEKKGIMKLKWAMPGKTSEAEMGDAVSDSAATVSTTSLNGTTTTSASTSTTTPSGGIPLTDAEKTLLSNVKSVIADLESGKLKGPSKGKKLPEDFVESEDPKLEVIQREEGPLAFDYDRYRNRQVLEPQYLLHGLRSLAGFPRTVNVRNDPQPCIEISRHRNLEPGDWFIMSHTQHPTGLLQGTTHAGVSIDLTLLFRILFADSGHKFNLC